MLPPPTQLAAVDSSQLQEVLQLVHPAAYLKRLQEICASLQSPTMIDDSTYIAPGSFGACCEVGGREAAGQHRTLPLQVWNINLTPGLMGECASLRQRGVGVSVGVGVGVSYVYVWVLGLRLS